MLGARTILAIFVAWGSILEMTRPSTFTTQVLFDPGIPSATTPGVTYTMARVRTTIRGWPVEFYVKTGLPEKPAPFGAGIRPVALLCDLIVLGVLVVGAWNLLGRCRLQFDLADVFTVTTSVALALSFHVVAWDRPFDLSQLAIDVGVFSAAITIARAVRKFAARLSRWHAGRAGGT